VVVVLVVVEGAGCLLDCLLASLLIAVCVKAGLSLRRLRASRLEGQWGRVGKNYIGCLALLWEEALFCL
jgi:hypothetical protein